MVVVVMIMMLIVYGSDDDDVDDCIIRPVIKTWRLNERMYGALEGHSKPGAVSH